MKTPVRIPRLGLACVVALAAGLALGGACHAASITFTYTGSLQQYTIPTTETYSFTVGGAQGGIASPIAIGGQGTVLGGNAFLTAGTVLDIVVGGMGGPGLNTAAGGGGGGTFVYIDGAGFLNNPLIVAGGGGGAGPSNSAGLNTATMFGQAGGGLVGQGGAGGMFGSGGSGGGATAQNGGGGAGWFGNGGAGIGSSSGGGGLNGPLFTGGAGGTQVLGGTGGAGGYGGGGGGGEGGGGGGGYSGGGGGNADLAGNNGFAGGGGGSFFDSAFTSTSATANSQTGNGFLTIELAQAPQVPEPSSLVLGAVAAVIGAAAAVRSRLRRPTAPA